MGRQATAWLVGLGARRGVLGGINRLASEHVAVPVTRRIAAVAVLAGLLAAASLKEGAMAHPGGLNSQGCHNNRKTGEYHCHGGGPAPAVPRQQRATLTGMAGVFRNCAEARAAGAAPVRRGDPGYGPHLDRDDDGVGCEPYHGR